MEHNNDPHLEEKQLHSKLNPFTSVWFHPKQTARYMIDVQSIRYAILILSIGYIGSLLSGVMDIDIPIWMIVLLCVLLAPIAGIIGTSFSSFIAWLFGKLFKGTATFSELFKALSITAIPFIVLIPFYTIWLAISPESLLVVDYTGPLPWIFWVANLVTIVVSIWTFVITVAAVAEAHQISNWAAFFTVFIPTIMIGFLFFIIIVIIFISIFSVGMF